MIAERLGRTRWTPAPPRRIHRPAAWLGALARLGTLAVMVAACGMSASPGPSFPASPVEGVIVAVDASSLSDVRGFTLLLRDGSRIAFTLGTLEDPTAFPPGHLKEHEATSAPILVSFRVENGVPVVYRLDDAPGASAPPTGGPHPSRPGPT